MLPNKWCMVSCSGKEQGDMQCTSTWLYAKSTAQQRGGCLTTSHFPNNLLPGVELLLRRRRPASAAVLQLVEVVAARPAHSIDQGITPLYTESSLHEANYKIVRDITHQL